MKVVEKHERRNSLLKRTEYSYVVSHPSGRTPSRAEMQKLVSEELGVPATRVDIRKIYSRKGMAVTDVRVFVWDEEKVEDLNAGSQGGAQQESAGVGENQESAEVPAQDGPEEQKEGE